MTSIITGITFILIGITFAIVINLIKDLRVEIQRLEEGLKFCIDNSKEVLNDIIHNMEEQRTQIHRICDILKSKTLPTIQYVAPDGVELKKAYEGDACYDLYTSEDVEVKQNYVALPTGLKIALVDGYVARVLPRSGVSLKGIPVIIKTEDGETHHPQNKMHVSVTTGTVDSGYRGEIKVIVYCDVKRFKNTYNGIPCKYIIPAGTKIAQLDIRKMDMVETEKVVSIESDTERAEKGFNSSGYTDKKSK